MLRRFARRTNMATVSPGLSPPTWWELGLGSGVGVGVRVGVRGRGRVSVRAGVGVAAHRLVKAQAERIGRAVQLQWPQRVDAHGTDGVGYRATRVDRRRRRRGRHGRAGRGDWG